MVNGIKNGASLSYPDFCALELRVAAAREKLTDRELWRLFWSIPLYPPLPKPQRKPRPVRAGIQGSG